MVVSHYSASSMVDEEPMMILVTINTINNRSS
jgi:hypothetical protein